MWQTEGELKLKPIWEISQSHLLLSQVGDRILSLNGKDVRHSTEQAVIDLIKEADFKIELEIQTFDKSEESNKNDPRSNGYMQAKNKFNQGKMRDIDREERLTYAWFPTEQTPNNNNNNNNTMTRQPTVRNEPKRNTTFSASSRNKHAPSNYMQDEDDEDTRDMTGRIRTEAGCEVGSSL